MFRNQKQRQSQNKLLLKTIKFNQRTFVEIVSESLIDILKKMYDENNDFIKPIPLFFYNIEDKWILLGQLIWSFIINSVVATSAIALQTLRKAQFITFCPQHPSIIFKKKKPPKNEMKCIVSGCNYYLCTDYNKWYMKGKCPKKQLIPLGDRACPYCHAVIEKTEACNHIRCNCGKHFCYYWGEGPWDNCKDCYNHINKNSC